MGGIWWRRCRRGTAAALLRMVCVPVLAGTLCGCVAFGDVAPEVVGLGAGAGAGVVTANPLVGVAVGIGARYAAAEGVEQARGAQGRRVQDAIAEVAGEAEPESVVPWATEPDFLLDTVFGEKHGHLQVLREFGGRIPCRELLFTEGDPEPSEVQGGASAIGDGGTSEGVATAAGGGGGGGVAPGEQEATAAPRDDWPSSDDEPVLIAVVCRGPAGWRWAVAQPATGSSS